MSLTSAMLTGFTGINSNSTTVDTVGNNLANLNTTAFKSQRTLFETLLYQTISEGEGPNAQGGGTLPRQIGFGSGVAAIQRNFDQGGLEGTGLASDLAIDGDGFFVLAPSEGERIYTRDGAFTLDASQTLVSLDGAPVQVFEADASGAISTDTLTKLVLPLGAANQAIATSEVLMDGHLDSRTNPATLGAISTSQPLATASGVDAAATTALTELVDANGLPLFATDDSLVIRGSKGGVATRESTFIVGTTGSTLGDLAAHLEQALGINIDDTTGGGAGVTISDGTDLPAGSLVVRSNPGEINAIELDGASITNTTGLATSPFSFATTTSPVGQGVTTSFGAFDSLGQQLDVRLRMALESKSDTGTTWRFYAESADDTDASPFLGTGTVSFDVNGQFVGSTGTDLTIDRAGVGSASPMPMQLDFSRLTGLASSDGSSELVMASQDGAPAGILTGYEIAADGTVTGTYSNQQTQVFGQVALATFTNTEGLVALGENNFAVGLNSGDAVLVAPQTSAAGRVIAGSLEQSNVEIAREFINLISASTGISSAGRVVRVADDLLQELLLIAR